MSSKEQKQQLLSQKLYRSLKSKRKTSKDSQVEKSESSKKPKSTMTKESSSKPPNEVLTKRAVEEIQREALKRSKLADEIGPSAWRVSTIKKANKRFLANTMRSVLSHNERTTVKHATKSQRKFDELDRRPPKFGKRLHSFQSNDERQTKQQKTGSMS